MNTSTENDPFRTLIMDELDRKYLVTLREAAEEALLKESATFPTDKEMAWFYENPLRNKVHFRFGESREQCIAFSMAMPKKHRRHELRDNYGMPVSIGFCSTEATRFLQDWFASGRSRKLAEDIICAHLNSLPKSWI